MASGPITSWQIDGEWNLWENGMETMRDFIFLGSKVTVDDDSSHEFKKHLLLGRKAMTNPGSILKRQRHHFAGKDLYSQIYGFSSSHVQMWELDHKETWEPKNCCFRIVVLEKTLESPLDSKEIKPVNPKGNQPWINIGRPDADTLVTWCEPKRPGCGKDLGQKEKEMTEDEMVGWHHWFNAHVFGQTLGDSEG